MAICSCYRRDEAQNPEMFAAALAIVLGDYPTEIVNYAADPRTGVITRFPMGLPNVGQIKVYLDETQAWKDRLKHYGQLPKAEFARLPKPPAGPGAWANVFVPADALPYARMVELTINADHREWRYDTERQGIWVALSWLQEPTKGKSPQPLPDLITTTPELQRWADAHNAEVYAGQRSPDEEFV
jgi:hypothetical protein